MLHLFSIHEWSYIFTNINWSITFPTNIFNFHLIYPSPSAESDYNDIVLEFDFTSRNETDCGIIFLVDDDIIEDTEELIITLNNGDEADFVNGTATVTILDDDGTS